MGLRAAAHSSSSSIDSSNHPDLDDLLPKPSGSSSSSSLPHKIKIIGGTICRNSSRSTHTRTDLSTDLRLGLSISPCHHSDLSSTTSSPSRYVIVSRSHVLPQMILNCFPANKSSVLLCSFLFQGGSIVKLAADQINLEEHTFWKSRQLPSSEFFFICEGLHGRNPHR